jgi:hypothetical protein
MTLQSHDDVRQLTEDLEAFTAWRDVLLWKLKCSTVHFEFVNMMREVREFKRECAALAKNIRRASA